MAYLINFVDRALGVREREGAQILHVIFYYPYGLAYLYLAALDSIKVCDILHHLLYKYSDSGKCNPLQLQITIVTLWM